MNNFLAEFERVSSFFSMGPTHLWGVRLSLEEICFVRKVLRNHLGGTLQARDVPWCGNFLNSFLFNAADVWGDVSDLREPRRLDANDLREPHRHAHDFWGSFTECERDAVELNVPSIVLQRAPVSVRWSPIMSVDIGLDDVLSQEDSEERGVFSEGDADKNLDNYEKTGRSLSVEEVLAEIDAALEE